MLPGSINIANTQMVKRVEKLMGNRFEISVIADTHSQGQEMIELAVGEIKRIEQLLSTFRDDSQANDINQHAGIKPVQVDREVFDLISRSVRISELTQGAFDITYGSIDKSLWNFDLTMSALPDPDVASLTVRLINFRNILLDPIAGTVFLRHKGMRIGFGGIGKGYAADKAKLLLKSLGCANGIVNAAGDLVTWGTQAGGHPWTIGIADPDQVRLPFSTLKISDMAVATSGNYEKFVTINGKKYSHTINPLTGMPVTGIRSATIISPSAELADAMATPVMVMGVEVGLNLINQMKQVACIIIDDHNKIHVSRNINLKY